MSPAEAKTRIESLTSELKQHNYNYYVLAMPTIADYDFDKKLEELTPSKSNTPSLPTLTPLPNRSAAISPKTL